MRKSSCPWKYGKRIRRDAQPFFTHDQSRYSLTFMFRLESSRVRKILIYPGGIGDGYFYQRFYK